MAIEERDLDMNQYKLQYRQIFFAGIIGTSLMTLFSYWMSWLLKDNFKEPALLNLIISHFLPDKAGSLSNTIAWFAHYASGCMWAFIYFLITRELFGKISFAISLFMGGIFGVIASYAWLCCFSILEEQPDISFSFFYAQLIIGHVIVVATAQLYANSVLKAN